MSARIRNQPFRDLCAEHSVTIKDLAHICDVSPASISHLLNGRRSPDLAARLAQFFYGRRSHTARLLALIRRGRRNTR